MTATAYDATNVIINGLKRSTNRNMLQEELHKPDFKIDGATGKIQFSKLGNRIETNIFLMQVQCKANTEICEFVPI